MCCSQFYYSPQDLNFIIFKHAMEYFINIRCHTLIVSFTFCIKIPVSAQEIKSSIEILSLVKHL